jgi:hypothetical protein
LVGVEELDTLLPVGQEEERTEEEAGEQVTLCCRNAGNGCPFKVVGGTQNSLNAHLRHCRFVPATKATEPVAKVTEPNR